MTLGFCRDLSAADWIIRSDLPWQRLVGFGPAGFDAYARLRFLPDPVRLGQSENDVEPDWRTEQLPRLFEVLAGRTATPDDCYFCVWDGFADDDASLGRSKVVVPHRAYWLFRGPLAGVGAWDTAQGWPGRIRLHQAEPAFVWPADHAWCVANDVDPHWAGIGGTTALITRLTADPLLDVVAADPTTEQPFYR